MDPLPRKRSGMDQLAVRSTVRLISSERLRGAASRMTGISRQRPCRRRIRPTWPRLPGPLNRMPGPSFPACFLASS